MCSAYQGCCLRHPRWHTSMACLGTCIENMPVGAGCSGGALNIHPFDLDRYTGDDDVRQSGRCASSTLTCQPNLPNGQRCVEDADCASGRCASTFPFTCQTLLENGSRCWADNDYVSERCNALLRCQDKLPLHRRCGEDEDCQSNYCAWTWLGKKCRAETTRFI